MSDVYKNIADYNPHKKRKVLIVFNDMIGDIEDQIRDKKLQHDINRETAKISALLSGKIDKY